MPELNGIPVDDTYAEAFACRIVRFWVTAMDKEWVDIATRTVCGFATSTIACDCEAGVDMYDYEGKNSPDHRPGAIVMMAYTDKKEFPNKFMTRLGQCILTCPTTAVFDAYPEAKAEMVKDKDGKEIKNRLKAGFNLRFFGDGFEEKEEKDGRTLWHVPRMDGDFVIETGYYSGKGVAGGNFIIYAKTQKAALDAALRAVKAIEKVEGAITPFPGGVCGSGSKTGSLKYSKFLHASTNHRICPSIKSKVEDTMLPADCTCVTELVIDGMDDKAVKAAMAAGLKAAASDPKDLIRITAGNYGGTLGKFQFHLKDCLA